VTEPVGPPPAPDAPGDAPVLAPAARLPNLRLATLHLRMGMLPLARAELEAAAGRGKLDELALLDLAEARWRTGDLAGAGDAAHAALERGIEAPLAYLISAEAIAALGRPSEARRLAGRALERSGGSLDALFAGMPRATMWPADPVPEGSAALRARTAAAGPASPAAAESWAGGRAALAAGDIGNASLRLGVAIRLEPGFAQGVLDALGDRTDHPALALVAGDALRLLGRESDALEAFDRARGRLEGRPQRRDAEPPPDDEG
jgi:tetratricopeptide (TPR) repeat protein